MKSSPILISAATLSIVAAVSLTGQESGNPPAKPQSVTLFTNVRIFDGKSDKLTAPSNVLVRGNKIEKISTDPIPTDRRGDTVLIDGKGRTLMPGLIDAHVHTMMESIPLMVGLTSDIGYINLVAARAAEKQLLRGFTTVRDLGGASMSLKAAIDQGLHHGQLIDEDTAKLIADKGVWWCLQPFMEDPDAPSAFPEGSPNRIKQLQMFAGTDTAYKLAKKHHIKTAFGTDMLFSPANVVTQGKQLTRLTKWYSNAEVLQMATSGNAELLTLSGPRNPYPGKLGVVEEGAFADLLLVDGDPVSDINLIADPEKNFSVIMKDGVIYKKTDP